METIEEKGGGDAVMLLKIVAAMAERPEIIQEIEETLKDSRRVLFGVKDVAQWTGWSEGHIRKLCQAEELPHIPGKELKFVREDVVSALKRMQRGGEFGHRGRRKFKKQ